MPVATIAHLPSETCKVAIPQVTRRLCHSLHDSTRISTAPYSLLAFLLFLGHLFPQIAAHIEKDCRLAKPLAWRQWLNKQATRRKKTNCDQLYCDVLQQVYVEVCVYFRDGTGVGVTTYAAFKGIVDRLGHVNLTGPTRQVSRVPVMPKSC